MSLIKKYKCMNIGNCDNANKKTVFEIAAGEELKCPCCKMTMIVEVKKKPIGLYAGIAVAVIVLGGGGAYFLIGGDPTIENLQLNKSSRELFVGDKDTLAVTNLPAEAKATYIWESNNPEVATVKDGIVTMIGKGKTTISVIAQENKAAKATCDYTVMEQEVEPKAEEPVIAVETIAIKETEKDLQLAVGDEVQLTVEFSPEGASDKLSWMSSDDAVATVSESGLVTAVKAGKVTIKTSTQEDKSASVVVTVKKDAPTRINLPYGYFEGPTNGSGKPNGIGIAYVTKGYSLDLKNRDKETLDLKPGDKIMNAKFKDGNLQQGELQRKDGTRKTIQIGG